MQTYEKYRLPIHSYKQKKSRPLSQKPGLKNQMNFYKRIYFILQITG